MYLSSYQKWQKRGYFLALFLVVRKAFWPFRGINFTFLALFWAFSGNSKGVSLKFLACLKKLLSNYQKRPFFGHYKPLLNLTFLNVPKSPFELPEKLVFLIIFLKKRPHLVSSYQRQAKIVVADSKRPFSVELKEGGTILVSSYQKKFGEKNRALVSNYQS